MEVEKLLHSYGAWCCAGCSHNCFELYRRRREGSDAALDQKSELRLKNQKITKKNN